LLREDGEDRSGIDSVETRTSRGKTLSCYVDATQAKTRLEWATSLESHRTWLTPIQIQSDA
jgi:hypothetical protein